MGHVKVEPSDILLCSCLLDVLVYMDGINADPEVCVFAGTEINVRPLVHSRSRREEG
jgi:hypothetical protein